MAMKLNSIVVNVPEDIDLLGMSPAEMRKVLSEDLIEQLSSFIEKRKGSWGGVRDLPDETKTVEYTEGFVTSRGIYCE